MSLVTFLDDRQLPAINDEISHGGEIHHPKNRDNKKLVLRE